MRIVPAAQPAERSRSGMRVEVRDQLLEVRASAKARAANGFGQLELESATLGGVPIPKSFLQMIVSHYSATAENPNGFNLDQPFELPHQIRQVELQRGSAVVVQ